MGEMRSSQRALPLGVTIHHHTDPAVDSDLTSCKSLPQTKALRRIENHVEAVPGTTALLLSVMDPPKKKSSVSGNSRVETRGSSKSSERGRSSSKKRRSRSPLRNATQDSNVAQHNSMALREQLAPYRETAPPSLSSSQLESYRPQSISEPVSSSSDALLSKSVSQKDTWDERRDSHLNIQDERTDRHLNIQDERTDGHLNIQPSGDCTEVCYLNDPTTVDAPPTYDNHVPSTSPVPAMESGSPEAEITQSAYIQMSSPIPPPPSDMLCRWESSPSTSPGSDSQRLENLRRHQPDDKLEKLKERIRRQVKYQEVTAEKEKVLNRLDQPIMTTRRNNGGTAAKIRKVAAAPQVPTYKGFSKIETRTHTNRTALKEEACKSPSKQFAERTAPRQQRERYRPAERETKPTRKIHRAVAGQNPKTLITPASWREGSKLVNKILGAAPKQPRETRNHINDKVQHPVHHHRPNAAKTIEAKHQTRPRSTDRQTLSGFKGRSQSHSTSPCSPSPAVYDNCPLALAKDPLSAEMRAILDDPQFECKADEEEQRSQLRSGRGKGRPRGKARSLSQTRTSHSCGTTAPVHGPYRGSRSANPSLNRPQSSSVYETQEKKRHYDSDKIRQYMMKQKEERKRQKAEEKKSLKELSEKKNQRLQDVYRRQKEMAKTVFTPVDATATNWQKRYREDTYNLLTMDESQYGVQMHSSAASHHLRPMYQPSGESDKENKKLELLHSPSSSDRSLSADQIPPLLTRGDLDVGVTSSQNADFSPVLHSQSVSSTSPLGCASYEPLFARPLRPETQTAACDVKPALTDTPIWSQSRRSRIDALKATAISLSHRIENEGRQIARVGINFGEATPLDTDILARRRSWVDLDQRTGSFDDADLTPGIQRMITSAGLSPCNSASLPGAGNLYTFKGQQQEMTADCIEQSPSSCGLERNQVSNCLERRDDMPHRTPEDNREKRTDQHDSSGGSISEGTILSEGSFSQDEMSLPHPPRNHIPRLMHNTGDSSAQRIELQRLTDFQKDAAKCLALTSTQNRNIMPWDELSKGDPFSVINIYLKNLNVKVNDRNSPSARSFQSGESHEDAAAYEDDFASFHSSQQSKKSSSPHSCVGLENKMSPPSQERVTSLLALPDLGLAQAAAALKNESLKNGKLQYSPSALHQQMVAELKYQESLDESLRQFGNVERLLGLPVMATEAKQQKSPPSRGQMTSPPGVPNSTQALDFLSQPPRNGFNVGTSNSSRAAGNLQYSPAALHQHMTAELQYQESIDESMRKLWDAERLLGVSMAQSESAVLEQMLEEKQQKHENDLYEQKIQAEREALEAQLQREEDRQRTNRAHEKLLEKIVLTQKETAETARHIKELTDLTRTQIEGALTVSGAAPESLILNTHQRQKENKSDSDSYQTKEASRSLSHKDSRPLQNSPLIVADASCSSNLSDTLTDHQNEVIKEDKNDMMAEREAGNNSIEEECPTAENDSLCSESIASAADVKDYSFKFDSSRTEDEVEERSFSSLLSCKEHRRSSIEKRARCLGDSEDELADCSTNDVSGSSHVSKHHKSNMAFSGGKDSFSRFTMDMVRQHMKDEDLRLQHQNALLRLRQKAVKEKIRTELAWLEHQKKQLRNKGEDDKLPPIRKKQKGLLLRLHEEQAEIKRLQEANKVARKEKQLLLKQQEEIERMRTSTQRLKERLKSAGGDAPTESLMSETPVSEAAYLRPTTDGSRSPSPSPSVSASETSSIMQKLKKMRSRMDEKFLTKREQQLMQRRHHAEELLQWKKRLDEEEAEVRRIEREALAGWKGEGSKAISESIPKSSHIRKSEPRAICEKAHVTEDDDSSVISDCSIRTEEARSPSSAQPVSVAELMVASNLSSPPNYIEDFASFTRSKQSSPIKDSQNRASLCDISTESKMQLQSSVQISKQTPSQPVESPVVSQTEPISEQSDIENRIKALKEELRKRKLMATQLKREQKMRHKERLKEQEATLRKQLESYDNYIGKTKAALSKEPEPLLHIKIQKEDSSLAVDQSGLTSPARSETSDIPTVGLDNDASFHQNDDKSTSASEEPHVEAVLPSPVLDSPSFAADVLAQPKENSPSIDNSCRLDLDVMPSVKETAIRDVQASPQTDYQDDFESASLEKDQHIPKSDSICHTEIQIYSQDEDFEEEIAEESSHSSVTIGSVHESGRLLKLQRTNESKNDNHSIDSICPTPLSHKPSPVSMTTDEMPGFNIGDRVLVGNAEAGTLRFKGPTSFAGGFWAGVELDKSEGSNCGTYDGVVYFECQERHGIFAPPEKITHLSNEFEALAVEHQDSYSDHYEEEHKSEEDIFENIQSQEKSEETSHNDVYVELSDEAANVAQNLNSQELWNAETHLESQNHNQSKSQNGQESHDILNENVPSSQESIILEEPALTNREISEISEKAETPDRYVLFGQEISAAVEKETSQVNQLIYPECTHEAGDRINSQKDPISPDTLADKLLNNFLVDTVQDFLQIKRAKEEKIEASNQINFEPEEQRHTSSLEPEEGLLSFLSKEEPSSPELCNRLESPILGLSGQEELAKRLAELELSRDLIDDLGNDEDWFDEDFGLSSRREQQRLQQKEEDTRLGAGLGKSASFAKDPLNEMVSHLDGDQSAKTPPRPALPLPLPAKLPEQPTMVVPHSSEDVEKMVLTAVQEIWESCGLTKEGKHSLSHMNCPKPSNEFLGVEETTNDQEALAIRSYKKAVYDLTWEILQEIYAEDPNANQPEWVKPQRVRSAFFHRVKTPQDLNKVQEFVTEEVLKLYGLSKKKNKKSDWQKMLKFGRKKRDRVDQILVQELHEDEAQWLCYEEDELSVKMQLADSIFDMLLKDTVNTLRLITKRAPIS
ncbi:centrosome-associated protein 350 isoform X2 [Stigmatopora argus]